MNYIIFVLVVSLSSTLFADTAWRLTPEEMVKLSVNAGIEQNVAPKALYAIGQIESGRYPYAFNGSNRNKSADMGLMQINSSWLPVLQKHGLYNPKDIYNPYYNIRVGAWVLRQCVNRFGQSWKSIDCYNKGPGNARNSSEYVNRFINAYKSVPHDLFERHEQQLLASNAK